MAGTDKAPSKDRQKNFFTRLTVTAVCDRRTRTKMNGPVAWGLRRPREGSNSIGCDDFKAQIEKGASDQQMAEWLDQNGEKKTPEEIKRWGDEVEAINPYNDPERRDWFTEQVKPFGLDPANTTLFHWLEVDDKACHAKAA